MKKAITITVLFYALTKPVYACISSDSTRMGIYIQPSEYVSKSELTNNPLSIDIQHVSALKKQPKKAATILRIVAVPLFVTALFTTNSKELFKGLLITGATLELTSIYMDLHKKKRE